MMSNANVVKVSIVVPAFNVELYLEACLDSLIAQTLEDIEIIVINDGSTDRTGKIADEYAKKDARIRIMHKENQGLSAARNQGIKLAQGKYIAFVDSDDWVKLEACERLYECAEEECADMVLGSIVCYKEGQEVSLMGEYESVFKRKGGMNGKECLMRLIQTGSYLPMVYMNLYRTELIKTNRLYFKYRYHEDEFFTPYVFYYAERVVHLEYAFYYYRIREGSIMRSASRLIRANCCIGIANDLFEFVENILKEEKKDILIAMLQHACCLFLRAVRIYTSFRKEGEIFENLPVLKCYKLNVWKEYLGNNKGLERMYSRVLNEQRKFYF